MYPDQASLKLSLSCGFLMRDTENHDLGQDFTIITYMVRHNSDYNYDEECIK